MTALFGKGGS
uniref:Uncharacterized protein n=1 Tax=Arundo donax TaxID=35708 RepID=A0A0A8ZIX0_ARUDO